MADGQLVEIGGNGAVLAERRGHTLLITLNRPQVRNAVNQDMTIGISDALELAEQDRQIWSVVLTGAGDRAFCAGMDLKDAAAGRLPGADERVRRWGFAGYVRHHLSKPTIAAVNGFALGGGTEIALASDLVVAADSAAFGLPEVTRGIYPGAGGAFRLPRQIPVKIALEAMYTGRPISAARAHELGLVNSVVPAGRVVDEALALADAINQNAPIAVQATKRIALGIEGGQLVAEDEDWRRNALERDLVMGSDDCREGMRAFAEKRPAQWSGR